ncbi:MAG TPA: hypothetical protein DCQ36_00480, partial [Actinobacteria bacterium]|nr:hypothetical protein [Actinomycetota bacterium]
MIVARDRSSRTVNVRPLSYGEGMCRGERRTTSGGPMCAFLLDDEHLLVDDVEWSPPGYAPPDADDPSLGEHLTDAEWFDLVASLDDLGSPANPGDLGLPASLDDLGFPVTLGGVAPAEALAQTGSPASRRSGPRSSTWAADCLASLHGATVGELDTAETLQYLRTTERLIAHLHALESRALVHLAGSSVQVEQHRVESGATVTIVDPARTEAAAALRWSESQAHDRITMARLLSGALPLTSTALAAGDISYHQAQSIADVVGRHSAAVSWLDGSREAGAGATFLADAQYIEERAVPAARRSTASAARKAADRALRRRDADHVRARREQAMRRRDAWIEIEPDGTALLLARMGVIDAHACLGVIDTLARDPHLPVAATTSTDAGIGERRSDALLWMLLGRPG